MLVIDKLCLKMQPYSIQITRDLVIDELCLKMQPYSIQITPDLVLSARRLISIPCTVHSDLGMLFVVVVVLIACPAEPPEWSPGVCIHLYIER